MAEQGVRCDDDVTQYVVTDAVGNCHSHHDEDDSDVAREEAEAIGGKVYAVVYASTGETYLDADYTTRD